MAIGNNRTAQIDCDALLPDTQTAITLYRASDGRLGEELGFGIDPLRNEPALIEERQRLMAENVPSPKLLFGWIVNGVTQPFMIEQTKDLEGRFL